MSILSFDLSASLRRIKPQKHIAPLQRRVAGALQFAGADPVVGASILLDTTVYIDALQDSVPAALQAILGDRLAHHSSVAVAELAHAFGRLDPDHRDTKGNLTRIERMISAIPPKRLGTPSAQATIEANIVVGIVGRLRGLAPADRQPLFNDAMLFLQALENGWTLVSRNVADFDLIQQIVPEGRMLFYRQTD